MSGGSTEKIWFGLAKRFALEGHSVTFVSRRWAGQADDEIVDGIHHVRVQGFNHRRRLAHNLFLDLIWGFRVARALPRGDIVVCNALTLPVWLNYVKPSAGKVCVMLGRAPKGQVRYYRGVARIYAPSSFIAGKISQSWAMKRAIITGYPIDWPTHAHSSNQSAPPVIVGFVGRLHPEKGIELLLLAARILAGRPGLPEWRIRIVGPASINAGGGGEEWIGALRSEAERDVGGRIEWLAPEFDPARLACLYGTMDIFCYPSLAEKGETFGVAVAEAMASRCTAVVSALKCFSDLVADGRTGLVFDHSAPDAEQRLADCLGRLIVDQGLRHQLALEGQAHVRRFDYPEMARKILADLSLLTGTGAEKRQ